MQKSRKQRVKAERQSDKQTKLRATGLCQRQVSNLGKCKMQGVVSVIVWIMKDPSIILTRSFRIFIQNHILSIAPELLVTVMKIV